MTVRWGRTTLREVAAATGLSTAAVSYALRGKQVSKETEERVRRAAAELGYEADPVARALAGGRTGMVGVLSGDLQDLWQQRFNAVLGRELLDAGLHALIVDAGADPERQLALATQLRDQRVEAVIVSALDPSTDAWAALADTVPLISLGDALTGARTAGEILFDNRTGMDLALSHLHALGHRRVAVLTPTLPSTPDRPADVYAAEAVERLGLDATIVACARRWTRPQTPSATSSPPTAAPPRSSASPTPSPTGSTPPPATSAWTSPATWPSPATTTIPSPACSPRR